MPIPVAVGQGHGDPSAVSTSTHELSSEVLRRFMRANTTVSSLGTSESSKASDLCPGALLASRSPTTSLQARLEWRTISMLCE